MADNTDKPLSLDNNIASDLRNEYPNISTTPVQPESDRITPRQVSSGVERGTKIIMNVDGSYIEMGALSDGSGDFGIAFYDAQGRIVSKMVGPDANSTGKTDYYYDETTGRNYMQIGRLPDGSYNIAITQAPYNISDAIRAD
jgi:hypothetical protein